MFNADGNVKSSSYVAQANGVTRGREFESHRPDHSNHVENIEEIQFQDCSPKRDVETLSKHSPNILQPLGIKRKI